MEAPIDKQALIRERGGHCEYEGCRETRHLELHHAIVGRRKGMSELLTVPENLEVLCSVHHRSRGHSYKEKRAFWARQVKRGFNMASWYQSINLKAPENFE